MTNYLSVLLPVMALFPGFSDFLGMWMEIINAGNKIRLVRGAPPW
jgi:hypothetical protein